MAYATTAQLATYLNVAEGDLTVGDRELERASELLDEVIVTSYDTDDSDVEDALADATCAQVEFWLEVGEEHDISGQRGSISVGGQGGLEIDSLPQTLAIRARRALARENLLVRSVQAS